MNSTVYFVVFVLGTLSILTSALPPSSSDSDSLPIVDMADKSSASSSKVLQRDERFLGGFGFSKSFALAGGGGRYKNGCGTRHKTTLKNIFSLLIYMLEFSVICLLFSFCLEESNYEDYDIYDEDDDLEDDDEDEPF